METEQEMNLLVKSFHRKERLQALRLTGGGGGGGGM